jgi:hypothetical protein
VHDFVIPELGKVAPYGVYDVAANDGWVNLGISHDTAALTGRRAAGHSPVRRLREAPPDHGRA